jgi:hypothetical protein
LSLSSFAAGGGPAFALVFAVVFALAVAAVVVVAFLIVIPEGDLLLSRFALHRSKSSF